MWTGVKKQSAFGVHVDGKKYFLLFDAFCFQESKPLLDSLHQRCLILPLSFSSLGHNMQSHDLQLTALIQSAVTKTQYVNPWKNCVPPLHYKFTCPLLQGPRGITVLQPGKCFCVSENTSNAPLKDKAPPGFAGGWAYSITPGLGFYCSASPSKMA